MRFSETNTNFTHLAPTPLFDAPFVVSSLRQLASGVRSFV